MWKSRRQCPRCLCRLLVAVLTLAVAACTVNCTEITDFVSTNTLPDGEVETRIYYEGVSAKETTVGKGNTDGIKFRQLTDGKHLIQLIYAGDNQLRDCEFGHQRDQVKSFLHNFKQDLSNLIATSNISVDPLDFKPLPEGLSWMNYTNLREICKSRHRELKKIVREAAVRDNEELLHSERSTRSKRSLLIVPGTLWCGHHHDADVYTQLGSLSGTDRCCRRHDHCKFNVPGLTEKYDFFNVRPFTLSHCRCDNRHKRDISDLFRVPGTKWCGKGYSADKYTRLGGFSRTDRCCRKHDLSCPFWIGGFETKYGLFNWRVNTLMHCNCDERFRACLKMVRTSDANLVGKLFFNVVQTKCFVLKPKRKCVRSAWWGKCEKHKIVKQAVLRDNLPF
ncbi:uncharacterized protein LOC108909097 isoform X3 [Anoplophora glabripennis]|uniref:uncharacterized protein LOC108909097 isoform X3 n=1 Tax=Anoplophora glabripennis TaxID=217634 RepID=UPI000873D8F7|nr:uncharacterized protein LOC108909097 isoform X3 [Anoplophora glabripennis]